MRLGKLRVCIVDDEASYFTPEMISLAEAAGFTHIERHFKVDAGLLHDWLERTPDIVILDIKGVAAAEVAKDGFGIAKVLYEQTPAYVVITSAHKFHLHEYHQSYDYAIPDRLLTAVDFIMVLTKITEKYLTQKIRFYRKVAFRLGFFIARKSLTPSPD